MPCFEFYIQTEWMPFWGQPAMQMIDGVMHQFVTRMVNEGMVLLESACIAYQECKALANGDINQCRIEANALLGEIRRSVIFDYIPAGDPA